MLKLASPILLGIAALAGCAPSAPPGQASATAADETAIRAGGDAWNTAYNGGDVDKIVALYTDDAVLMPPDAPAASGSAAIREYFTKDVAEAKAAGINVKDDGGTVGLTAELGWHAGKFSASDATGKTVSTGKYVELWRKKDGTWRMFRDIWNNDVVPPAEPAK
jgi:ketosteroid isomerase-like protein